MDIFLLELVLFEYIFENDWLKCLFILVYCFNVYMLINVFFGLVILIYRSE